MSLPTTGPLLLRALLAQDMYLAGTLILLISVLTIIGTLISDILLAARRPADPPRMTIDSEHRRRGAARAEIAVAGQWKLFWLKFRRHRLAVASLVVVILLYLTAAFAAVPGAVRPEQDQRHLHLRAAADPAPLPRRPLRPATSPASR